MQSFKLLLLLILGSLSFATGCDEDEDPNVTTNNRLQGDWEVSSFTVDGVEQIITGSVFDMEFEREDPDNGEFEWNFGPSGIFRGEYEIESNGEEIEFEFDAGGRFDMEVDIDGDDLELDGTVDNERWVIEAEKD